MKTKDLTTSQLRRRTMALAAAGLTSSQQEELRKRALAPALVAMRENYYKEVVAEPEIVQFSHVDFLKTIPGRQIDLRPKINALGLTIRDQGHRPTCVIFAMCFLLEYGTAVRSGRKGIWFSVEYLNYLDNLASFCGFMGGVPSRKIKDGGFYVDVNAGYQIFGRIAESRLPYQKEYTPETETKAAKLLPIGRKVPKLPMEVIKHYEPAPPGLSVFQLDLVCSYLDFSIPVAISCTWPAKKMTKTEVHDGITMMVNSPDSTMPYGHEIALVGYRRAEQFPGGGYFIFRNSWSEHFGDAGYGNMSFNYVFHRVRSAIAYSWPWWV